MLAWLDFDTEYLFYGFIGVSAFLLFEAVYLLFFQGGSYRRSINRRIELLKDQPDREGVLVKLRRERGLTSGGDYRLPVEAINRLILQSGLSLGVGKLALYTAVIATIMTALVSWRFGNLLYCAGAFIFFLTLGPLALVEAAARPPPEEVRCAISRCSGYHRAEPARRPSGAGRDHHGRPRIVGSVRHRIWHRRGRGHLRLGSRRCHAQSLFSRRPGRPAVFVTAVAIQGSTGGNLGEILENLSGVIRLRFKMRRKVRALAAEGRASAIILASLPIAIFGIINLVAPDFYSSVWHHNMTKMALTMAGGWMSVGIFIMYRMVNFKI